MQTRGVSSLRLRVAYTSVRNRWPRSSRSNAVFSVSSTPFASAPRLAAARIE
jgi:hypothetical protein